MFPVPVVLRPLPLAPTDHIMKYVKNASKHKTQKKEKLVGSWMCVQHQLMRVPAGGQLLLLLYCAKVGIDGVL